MPPHRGGFEKSVSIWRSSSFEKRPRRIVTDAPFGLGIHPALKFGEKLDTLEQGGHIDSAQRKALDALTDAGSAAAHRAWMPKDDELDTMFSIFEFYIHHSFVLSKQRRELEKRAATLAKNTPKKQKRP